MENGRLKQNITHFRLFKLKNFGEGLKGLVKKYRRGGQEHLEMWWIKNTDKLNARLALSSGLIY